MGFNLPLFVAEHMEFIALIAIVLLLAGAGVMYYLRDQVKVALQPKTSTITLTSLKGFTVTALLKHVNNNKRLHKILHN